MATIYDVARECGFSISTVSNVLNNGPRPVRPYTKQKVLEAVTLLDYHPNAVARGLARQRTNSIGIVFGAVESSEIVINPYSATILQAALAVASEVSFDVTHITTPWRGAARSLPHFRDGRTDGFIVVAPPINSDLIPSLASIGLPLVAVSWPHGLGDVLSVDVDDVYGANIVMDHLLELGHRKIAHITGNQNLLSAQFRQNVYADRMREAGLGFDERLMVVATYSAEAGRNAAKALLSQADRPTAIFAGNDEIALGVIQAAAELGILVPSQLSVIGVDDRPFAALVSPGLTTLHQPFEEVGREAASLLVQQIRGGELSPGPRLFKPSLVSRGSTAPPLSAQPDPRPVTSNEGLS